MQILILVLILVLLLGAVLGLTLATTRGGLLGFPRGCRSRESQQPGPGRAGRPLLAGALLFFPRLVSCVIRNDDVGQ